MQAVTIFNATSEILLPY